MEWRFKQIFRDEWMDILAVYKEFMSSYGQVSEHEEVFSYSIELGVRFGERLSELGNGGFTEIGCGLAIPSLTLAKLNCEDVRSIDIDPKIVSYAERVRDRAGCSTAIECYDIFEQRPRLKKNDMLIAEKPASYKMNPREVEYQVANWCKIERYNCSMIPSFLQTDTRESYNEKCNDYERKFRQAGFRVENRQILDRLPFRWLIATKWDSQEHPVRRPNVLYEN